MGKNVCGMVNLTSLKKGKEKPTKPNNKTRASTWENYQCIIPPTLGIYHLVWIYAGLCPVHDTWILGKQILLEVNLAQLSHPSVGYNAAIKSNELDLYTPKQTFK